MFKNNNERKLILVLENINYEILNTEDYKKIVLYLTDPNKDLNINLDIDESVLPDDKIICENYKRFIEKYIEIRKQNEQEFKESNNKVKLEESAILTDLI